MDHALAESKTLKSEVMFKVRCIYEGTQVHPITGEPNPNPVVFGEHYTVSRIRKSLAYPNITLYEIIERDNWGYWEGYFARLDGPCEVALMEQRQEAEGARLDAQFENVCSMVEKDGDTW